MGCSYSNFLPTPGNTYTLEFYLHKACFAIAVNNYFEVDDVFISYVEEQVVEKMNYSVSNQYRYSFQNQEKHDEIRGKGNYINYKYRGYDPRVGRLDWMVDPLSPEYPHNSPYAFSENRVLDGVELEGLEYFGIIDVEGKEFIPIIRMADYNNDKSVRILNPAKLAAYQKEHQLTLSEIENNPKTHHAALMGMSDDWGYFHRKERESQPNKEHTSREFSSFEKYGPVSVFGEKFASKFAEWSASLEGTEGSRKFAEGFTSFGAGLQMIGIKQGAIIEGIGLSYLSGLDYNEENPNAGSNALIRFATFGLGKGLERSIDKTGYSDAIKHLQKVGIGTATGEIRENGIEILKND